MATVAGWRPSSTVNPPSTAWSTTPTRTATEPTFMARRGAQSHTAAIAATARMPTTPVSVRLPNSTYLWKPSACSTVGVIEPSTHSGQVGHPRPLPVTRTRPPVTTIPTSATRLARRTGESQRAPARVVLAGTVVVGVVGVVLVTAPRLRSRVAGRSPGQPPRRSTLGQSLHRKNRAASPAPTAPHTTRTAHWAHGHPPSTNAVRTASPRAPEGR